MGVGGDEGGICYVGPPAEAEPTVAEGGKGEGGADGVEGVGERRESADDAEQGSVIGGLGAVEGWTATIDGAKEVGDAVLEGLESKDVLDVQAGAKPDGGEVGSDGGGCVGGKANFEVGGADGAAKDADAVKVDFFVGDDRREKIGGRRVGRQWSRMARRRWSCLGEVLAGGCRGGGRRSVRGHGQRRQEVRRSERRHSRQR